MTPKRQVSAGQARRERGQAPVYDSYARLSKNPTTGELEKIDDQWADNGAVIERLGGRLGEQLSDGLSAWKRTVRRPGWEKLLERVKAGESDGIVVWHTDRLFRQPRDLEALVDLADKGFQVASARGTRDLSDPDDRFILRIEVAHAARSSDDTSRRLKRRFQTLRANGQRTGGARPFGLPGFVILPQAEREALEAAGEERPMVPEAQVAAERQAIADGCRGLLAEQSLADIARKWNADGLVTPRGNRWAFDTVRRTLARPINAGLIEHDGVIVGRVEGDPIVNEDLFSQVQAFLAGRRQGRVAGQTGRKYVGSGILRCGDCDHALSARVQRANKAYSRDRYLYFCPSHRYGCGKVMAAVPGVDRELRTLVIARLSDPEHARQVSEFTSTRAQRLTEVRIDLEKAKRLQAALSERLGREEIGLEAFDVANRPVVKRLAGLRAERDSLESGELGPLEVASAKEIAAEWDALAAAEDIEGLRAMLRRALGRHTLFIDRATSRRPVFDKTRLRLERPDMPAPSGSTE
ncbi:MAG TPA: recombinase family protein [Pseudonocardiaceae bacterium]|jgi:DNA invertase Pin-like site-specific DNA recombinase|nr:recombinase family protein [Pseudonocardiaceae bacterium]